MANYRTRHLELLREAGQKGLYTPLVRQLHKDFERANVAVRFSETQDPETLSSLLHEKIYQLMMERFPDYLNVLYVVDVPERSFKQLELTDMVEVAAAVSFLILEREWKKVLIKRQYRS